MLLKTVFISLGLILGGVIGIAGLIGATLLIAQGVDDKTGLGWVWILMFITGPIGSILGGISGHVAHRRWVVNRNS